MESERVQQLVQQLKDERDEWRTRARLYQAAFESQTVQLREALDICVAAQADLQNERLARTRGTPRSRQTLDGKSATASANAPASRGSSTLKSASSGDNDSDWQSASSSNTDFSHIKALADNECYPAALEELDSMLPGPLSPGARVEALIMKSAMLRISGGSQWLYEALAQCSEALELCQRISDLAAFLPKIQYQRGICLFQLGLIGQAQYAFHAVSPESPLHEKALEYCKSCDEELVTVHLDKRRSGFEENRLYDESYFVRFKEGEHQVRKNSGIPGPMLGINSKIESQTTSP